MRFFTFGDGASPGSSSGLSLECGRAIGPVTLAYETWGELNEKRDNAVLVCHAFSGNSHVSSCDDPDGSSPGWWDGLVGPGKAVDTDRYFVVCSNVLGGCAGSTGPSSVNPATGKPYGLDFPVVTIRDMVDAQARLMDHLGIGRLLAVVGGSMGGMQALQWAASYPDRVRSVIPIATTLKHSPQQIALDEVGRQAVMADPDWRMGDYEGRKAPEKGLALARMIGHITYMSDRSMEDKFSRKLKDVKYSFSFATDFEVEGYLRYRGDNFVKRFDANSYLYITKAMDYFDLSGDRLFGGGGPGNTRFLVIGFHSDWLYPLHQSREIVRLLKMHGADATACEIKSTYGHDAFLLEIEEESRLIRHFLAKTRDLADREDQ
ncbi:homoserine O-acetyltransferase [bacterium]|nr:homoserine O-acetyltransferase [bacterium]